MLGGWAIGEASIALHGIASQRRAVTSFTGCMARVRCDPGVASAASCRPRRPCRYALLTSAMGGVLLHRVVQCSALVLRDDETMICAHSLLTRGRYNASLPPLSPRQPQSGCRHVAMRNRHT
ncbi:hypothetical protein TcWFU_010546 [Taenia crassiceps]|uniref:Uncharacterized protein n=1 Tax=Taenia crassiceps TaxID=6207 RepID=A0ABR4QN92_9CEST